MSPSILKIRKRKLGLSQLNLPKFGPYSALVAFVVFVFATGGGARPDIASLMILRPVSVGFLALGLYWLSAEQARQHRTILILGFMVSLICLLHLLPLPPFIWKALPGRDVITAIDAGVGLADQWRPLSLSPTATRNALWSLAAPLACLVLAIQTSREERTRLVTVLIVLVLISALLAIAQIFSDPEGILYFYAVTNNGDAVGLFANRNHQALLVAAAFPMLAFWARQRMSAAYKVERSPSKLPIWLGVCVGAFLIPLVLVTGSRSGLALALIALCLCPIVIGKSRWGRASHGSADGQAGSKRLVLARNMQLWGAILLTIMALALLTGWFDRALAIDRIFGDDVASDDRVLIWPTLVAMFKIYMPWGTGAGSFEKAFMVHEPDSILSPFYTNHAHNDWIEMAITGGILSMVLAICFTLFVAVTLARFGFSKAERAEVQRLARLGGAMLLLFALASVTDYPLRVPSLACLAALALAWISQLRVDTKAFLRGKVDILSPSL